MMPDGTPPSGPNFQTSGASASSVPSTTKSSASSSTIAPAGLRTSAPTATPIAA
jgi:hypothetical protein